MKRANRKSALIQHLRARLFRLRFRRTALRRLAAMQHEQAERDATKRVHAAWRREACDPEAVRIAREMKARAEMAVTG